MILITANSSKDLMAKLLVSDAFDSFCLQEAAFTTSVSYSISGRVHRDFYSEDELENITEEFIPWSDIRPRIFEIIKGKNLPLSLKMTLSLKSDVMDKLLQKESPEGRSSALKAFVINIRFENGAVNIITGTSYDSFVPDKSEEKIWDNSFARFLSSKGIEYSII